MKPLMMTIATALMLAGCFKPAGRNNAISAQAQRPSDAASEAYMRAAEVDWAALSWKNDPAVLQRILADDYVGVASENEVRDKKKAVAEASKPVTGTFVSSHLDYVHYRHFGDTVIAQGAETAVRADKTKPDLKLIWTDVWMWRDGKWQVVASQDSELPAK